MKPTIASWLCLFPFVVYCADQALKLPHIVDLPSNAHLWTFIVARPLRFAFIGALFVGFLYFRRKAKLAQPR